jgi:hypothetical protein
MSLDHSFQADVANDLQQLNTNLGNTSQMPTTRLMITKMVSVY